MMAQPPQAMLQITDLASGAVLMQVCGNTSSSGSDGASDASPTTASVATTLLEQADAGPHVHEYDALLDYLTRAQQACYVFFGKHAQAAAAAPVEAHSRAGNVTRRRGAARSSHNNNTPRHARLAPASPCRGGGVDDVLDHGSDGDADVAGCATEESSVHITSSVWSECEAVGVSKQHSQQQQQQSHAAREHDATAVYENDDDYDDDEADDVIDSADDMDVYEHNDDDDDTNANV